MDDGFQNPAVAKDASLIVIDSERAIGNGQVMPAGPLRAPLRLQIERTDALVVIGEGKGAESVAGSIAGQGKPVLRARFLADDASLAALRGKRALAFAGIGDPVRFFNTLSLSGIEVVRGRAFADHHAFSRREIEALVAEARRDALTLVTTEKDLSRLRDSKGTPEWARKIVPFAVTLAFDDAGSLRKFVSEKLFQAREKKFRA
jgi:tetraacyldisaccharide 4'-kinase